MAETKTRPTDASIAAYLAARASAEQMADCKTIMAMCERVTQQVPTMWGPSIVGYGSHIYRYDSGRTGTACDIGFAVRGKELVIYLNMDEPEQAALLARLGKHRLGKACLYIKRLADLDLAVLDALMAASVEAIRQRYPHVD